MLTELIGALGKRPVLVVTDAADGLERGAMVNFQLVDQRVRFEISLRKAQRRRAHAELAACCPPRCRVETSSCWYDCRNVTPTPELALIQMIQSLEASLPPGVPVASARAERAGQSHRERSELIANLAVDDHREQPSAADDVPGERG